MMMKAPILNKRCKVLYRFLKNEIKPSERYGVVTGFDSNFLYLEDDQAIPMNRIYRIEVKDGR